MFHVLCSMKKGFTLLEVIIAISVLTVGIGGSFSLIQQTLILASQTQYKLIAAYLAQEGIEIVRNIRDSNWLEQRTNYAISWDSGLADGLSIGGSRDYIADFQDTALRTFEDKPLNLNADGFYNYSSGTPTKFKRKINISAINAYTLEVSVEVQWQERGRTHQIKAIDHLYNWYGTD